MGMTPLERLIEIDAIKRLKARYTLFIDTKDYDSYRTLFTSDVTLLVDTCVSTLGRDGKIVRVDGRDKFVDFVMAALKNREAVHQCHTPLIDFASSTEAKAIWFLDHTEGSSYYRETYRKVDDEWKIASLHLARIRINGEDIDRS
jgi:hypothetical protein